MHTVTVAHLGAAGLEVRFSEPLARQAAAEAAVDQGPKPIAPEGKELAWGAGAFVVFALLMRLVLFPRVKRGMVARYGQIRSDHESADATRAEALREVAEYQDALAAVRREAASKVDAARRTIETERAARLAEVNARVVERRAAAMAAAETAKAAVRGDLDSAVAAVASRTVELAVGKAPSADLVARAVADVIGAGVSR